MRKLSSFKRIALRSLAALALALGATHAASAEECITDVMVVGGSSSSVTNSPAAVCPAWNQPYLSITATDNLTGSNYVSTAAARVGGIGANSAANSQFLYENELIALNTVWSAAETGVKRLLFLGSTCIYPRMAPQPIPESALLTSELEKTNEDYALAKISGLKLCEFLRRERGLVYHSLMPTNLYGPGDNYDTEHGHVLPTMIRKFETARVSGSQKVTLWGSGSPLREFLHVDDLASACLFLLEMENPPDLVNVGSGREVTIRQLAEMVKEATGSQTFIEWDRTKPDGTPRKLCDTRLIRKLGWAPKIDLIAGLRRTVDEYRAEVASGRVRV